MYTIYAINTSPIGPRYIQRIIDLINALLTSSIGSKYTQTIMYLIYATITSLIGPQYTQTMIDIVYAILISHPPHLHLQPPSSAPPGQRDDLQAVPLPQQHTSNPEAAASSPSPRPPPELSRSGANEVVADGQESGGEATKMNEPTPGPSLSANDCINERQGGEKAFVRTDDSAGNEHVAQLDMKQAHADADSGKHGRGGGQRGLPLQAHSEDGLSMLSAEPSFALERQWGFDVLF